MARNFKKLIVIVGPTASGKTGLAVDLARKINGEIVSADSRQVYKGMDIGTGKDLDTYGCVCPCCIPSQQQGSSSAPSQLRSKGTIEMEGCRCSQCCSGTQHCHTFQKGGEERGIRYHLIDVVSPKRVFTLSEYQKRAYSAIDDVIARGKTPMLVGGTGLYVYAVIDGYSLPEARPDPKLRKKLAAMSLPQLAARLKKLDPVTYATIDKANRRRVERALEICLQTGRPLSEQRVKNPPPYDILMLGMQLSKEKLYKNIDKRLKERLEQGMIEEVRRLHKEGVSWKRLESFGLEYRYISRYLRVKTTIRANRYDRKDLRKTQKTEYKEMVRELSKAIEDFSRRQMTWFRRDKRINWVKNKKEAARLVREFLA